MDLKFKINTFVHRRVAANSPSSECPWIYEFFDEFVSSSEQIWRNLALHDLFFSITWMGAVRMRVQTADKNIPIIHK